MAFNGFGNTASATSFGNTSASPATGGFGTSFGTSTFGGNSASPANFGTTTTNPSANPFGNSSSSTNTNTNTFGGFGSAGTPIFGGSTTQPAGTVTPATTGGDKTHIITCLTESKNVQMAILQELKTMNERMNKGVGNTPVPAPPIGVFNIGGGTTTHTAVFCNVCNKNNITGARYKCLFCKDFDMCEDCEAKGCGHGHEPMHVFIKIRDTMAFNAKMATKPALFCS